MKRRTNKSHRVPNVKLRPGEPQPSSSLAAIDSVWPEDSQLRSDDTTFKDTCPRPFKNVVLCATGISDKAAIFKKALELGASTTSAFTDKVSHLVAVAHGGLKYKCALEHGIPIVQPSWIIDNYDVWLHGDDVETDLERSIEGHRLPVFSDVVVCVSGIPELERRADIRRIVEQQGGAYVKAIERPVRVTHLLCSGDEESDKIRYAEKFIMRGEAQIHMVWEDWFWDSLKVKGRLEEARYNVRNPRPPPVVLRNTQPNIPDSTAPSRANSMNARGPPPPPTDELDEEAACVRVVPDITLKVWTGLLERRGYEVTNGEVIRSPSKSQNPSRSLTPPLERRKAKNSGVISAVRSDNTFKAAAAGSSRPMPFKRPSTASSSSSRPNGSQEGPSNQSKSASPKRNFFSGMRFALLDEAYTPAVVAAIEENGGSVVLGDGADIYVVRLSSASRRYISEENEHVRGKFRTECWLEQCIHEERVLAVDDHVSYRPLGISLPVPGGSAIHLSFSGLDQPEQLFTRRLLKTLGINHAPQFSKKSTHLLCPPGIGLKYDKALEWGIPVVTNDWLRAIAETGTIPDEEGVYTSGTIPKDVKGKGRALDLGQVGKLSSAKGKDMVVAGEMDVDNRMNDITNSEPDQPSNPSKPLGKSGGSLDRQHTTILAPDQETGGRGFGFGQPTEMLGSNPHSASAGSSLYAHHPSSVRPLTQGSPLVKYGAATKSEASFMSEGGPLSEHEQGTQNADPPRRVTRGNKLRKLTHTSTPSRKATSTAASTQTQSDDADYRDVLRIPSSESPSPMKIAHLQRNSSISPAKLDPGAAKALHESIASLLGKRHSAEDDELPAVESVEESAAGKSGGNGGSAIKRPKRPLRAKASTRARAKARKSSSPPPAGVPVDAVVSLSAFDPYGAAHPDEESHSQKRFKEDISARVLYEDPAQLQERQRLMNLLKTNGSKSSIGDGTDSIETAFTPVSSGKSVGGRATRRSVRL
ncbi:hypothetical protein FA13DRAFT_1663343, partial [Coprinellus micaceus]